MDRIKGLFAFWAVIIGVELAAVGLAVLIFSLSPVLRERTYEAMLVPNSPLLRGIGASQLRHYPSRAAAVALVAMLNLQGKEGSGQDTAEEALSSLRELSGESFQPGWKQGDAFVVPTSPEAWDEMMSRVNAWAVNAFGADALASLSAAGLLGDGKLTITTQAGSTADPIDAAPLSGSTTGFTYTLPEAKITLSFGDTASLAGRLDEAGIDTETRFASAVMSGDTVAVREILDELVENIKNGDTAEAAGVYNFFQLNLPEPAAPEAPAAGETTTAPTGENAPSAEPAAPPAAPEAEPAAAGETVDGGTEGGE